MNPLTARLTRSALAARVVPFVVFVVLTFVQSYFGLAGSCWVYLGKTLLAAWMLWVVRSVVAEMKVHWSWEAIVVGVGVFVIWVGLDEAILRLGFPQSYPKLKLSGAAWNPHTAFGEGTTLAWFFILVRLAGSSLVVPLLEEVFFRSFLYRYIIKADFLSVPLAPFDLRAFLITSVIFGLEHQHWLAGILCGLAYQGLVCRKKRLGDAITAHGITNLLLGLWVVWRGAWEFW